MTNAQRLSIRLSEIRQRLNTIAGLPADEMTDEIRAETDRLTGEFATAETQHRAALVAEADEARAAEGEFGNGDGEPAEVRALLDRVTLGEYLGRAAAGVGLAGAPVELAAALEVAAVGPSGGVAVPWRVLAGPEPEVRQAPERRAFTSTANLDGGVMQRPILQRLFGPGIMDALGVRMDSVPSGRSEWPLIRTGVAPTQKPEGDPSDAAPSAGIVTQVLKPKRLTGKYELTHEAMAQTADLEPALRRDLADAVKAAMNGLILTGDETTNAHEPDGFLTRIAAPADPADVAVYAVYAGSHAAGVDGLHASMEGEVSSVIGTATYTHAAGVYQAGSGESGSEALRRRSAGCMASSYIPAPDTTTNVQNGNIYHSAGPNGGGAMRGDSIAAVWPTLEVIRDIYTQASQGVVLTWVSLWDAETAFRTAAYQRVAFKLA